MELKYHVLALGGGILLGIIAAFVTKNILVGFILPIGIYVCAILWSKVKDIQNEESPEIDKPEVSKEAVSDTTVPPIQS